MICNWFRKKTQKTSKTEDKIPGDTDVDTPDEAKYRELWNTMQFRESRLSQIKSVVDKIEKNIVRYQDVWKVTNVPWYFIAALHNMESSCNFKKNLMNGQPLDQITTWVPKGKGPWETWEESAIEALVYDGLTRRDWVNAKIENMLFWAEAYNGLGYKKYRGINSPYLWSGSNQYSRGLYYSDGKYSPIKVSGQIGVAVIFKELENRGLIVIPT